MTETEAQSIVTDVLKGYWPDWEEADSMYGLWIRKLRKFDFKKAKFLIGEWLCGAKYSKKQPPINKMIQYLLLKKTCDESLRGERATPVKAFEIYCEDWQANHFPGGPPVKRHYSFWCASAHELKNRDPHEIEREAERARQKYISWCPGNWVIIQDWKRYFDEALI